MSVLGIDLGTLHCVLATIQRGTVTIVRNELSERLTPALVTYTQNERLVGEAAHSQLKFKFRNTCRNIKQLLGVCQDDKDTLALESRFALAPFEPDDGPEGLVGFAVQYKDEKRVFTATRVLAALLTKLKEVAEKNLGTAVNDAVISVPGWFSESARSAVIAASLLAGLNCLKVMNEHSAVALDYGIFRANTFTDKHRVAFVSVGHATTSVFVVDFMKSSLDVVSFVSDKNLGGRNFDRAIVEHFAEQFHQKHKVNPLDDLKMTLKLEDAATKAKKILTVNSEAPFNVECLWNDEDIMTVIDRKQFEEWCAPFVTQLSDVLVRAIPEPDTITSVEIIGGCTRIPWVQQTIIDFFKGRLVLSKTLNMDETVARGCALQAAMLNPRYRVREFTVGDRLTRNVLVAWEVDGQRKDNVELFASGSLIGTKKSLTFNAKGDILLMLDLASPNEPLVAKIKIPKDEFTEAISRKVKVRCRISNSGLLTLDDATLNVEREVEETITTKKKVPVTKEGGEEPTEATGGGEGEQPDSMTDEKSEPPQVEWKEESVQEVVKRVKTERIPCEIEHQQRRGFYSPKALTELLRIEEAMRADDRKIQEAQDKMNALESLIYSYRRRIVDDGDLVPYLQAGDADNINNMLNKAEEWVYENHEADADTITKFTGEVLSVCSPPEKRLQAKLEAEREEARRIEEAKREEEEKRKAEEEANRKAQEEAKQQEEQAPAERVVEGGNAASYGEMSDVVE